MYTHIHIKGTQWSLLFYWMETDIILLGKQCLYKIVDNDKSFRKDNSGLGDRSLIMELPTVTKCLLEEWWWNAYRRLTQCFTDIFMGDVLQNRRQNVLKPQIMSV